MLIRRMRLTVPFASLLVLLYGIPLAFAVTLPTPPQALVDITMPTVNGSSLSATCANFQSQVNAAAALNVNLTHEVILGPNGTNCGALNLTLPAHSGGTGWILLKGTSYAGLPALAPGVWVTPADAVNMPKLTYSSTSNSCVTAAQNAQRYRIIGFEWNQNNSAPNNGQVADCIKTSSVTHTTGQNTGYIIIDRNVAQDTRASLSQNFKRWVSMNSEVGNIAVIGSYCTGIGEASGGDAQCINADENVGPILIQDNYLSAAGENIMFGGGVDANTTALVPQDITIKRNYFDTDPAKRFQPNNNYGSHYAIKSLLELKTGKRVLIEGNNFNNMPWDQGGYAHRLNPRTINTGGATGDVSDIELRYNSYTNVTNWIQMFGSDNQGAGFFSFHAKRWWIHDNLVTGLGWTSGGGGDSGRAIFIGNPGSTCQDPTPTCQTENMTFTHNTIDKSGAVTRNKAVMEATRLGEVGLDFRDNIVADNLSTGLFENQGGGGANTWGLAALNAIWPTGYTYTNNAWAGTDTSQNFGRPSSFYPQGSGNVYPTTITNILFTNAGAGDYTLQAGSPAKSTASDGTDMGVNWAAYNAARAGAAPAPIKYFNLNLNLRRGP